jgi:pilus assembly protein CpaE
MNVVTSVRPAAPDPGRLQGVLAYVQDADSEAVLRRVATHLALPGFDVRRGGIAAATRDLKHQRSPALLFVDVSGVDTILDAVQDLSDVCEPQLQLVVIGEANDVGLYRGLMGLGVADYLFKPMTAELVEAVIWRLTNGTPHGGETRLGKLVAVCGARGGVGASSVAANLASYLAEKASRRVALVDLDVRTGAQALLLGAKPNPGLSEALEVPDRLDDLFLERATIAIGPRLDLLASEMPFERVPVPKLDGGEALIARLQRSYHYVLLDVPIGLRDVAAPLLASTQIQLLVLDATLLCARDTLQRVEAAASLGQRQILLHNKSGRPGDLTTAELLTAMGRAPDATLPFLPRTFGGGVNLGRPAWQDDPRAEAAVALLARELSGQKVKTAKVPRWKQALGLVP